MPAMRPLFRIPPVGPVQAYQTYEVSARTKPATCRDVECDAYVKGWTTVVDTTTDLGRRQANYIRLRSGRRFKANEMLDGRVEFFFYPGQRCFRPHTMPIGALFVKRGGDWRATTSPAIPMRAEDWIDDQQNTFDKIRTRVERG